MSAQHKQPSTHMAGSQLFTERPTIAQTALVILILLASLYAGSVHASGQHLLWYDRPAQNWNEALPIGNGRLGAMVYGNVAADRLQLNEETIWAGQPNNNANPEALEYLPKVRQLVWEGRYKEAQDLATQHVQSRTNHGMPYQPFGDLYLSFPGQGASTTSANISHPLAAMSWPCASLPTGLPPSRSPPCSPPPMPTPTSGVRAMRWCSAPPAATTRD